jgi:hypothetical protein
LSLSHIKPSEAANHQSGGFREQRLDFWRGLCLVDMLLVHLVFNNVQFGKFLGNLLGNYTRFAAGGFIFVSGLSIGVIFLPRALDDRRRPRTYRALWRRSAYILGVNYLSAMILVTIAIVIELIRNQPLDYTNPLVVLRRIFLLREGGDLLPFYVMMIAISPLLMEAVRRRWGWLCILAGSTALFAWGLSHPWALAPAQHDKFPPILWQIIFVLGFLFGWAWPRYNHLSVRSKAMMAALGWTAVGILFVMEYSYQWGMPQLGLGIVFTKVPLSGAEALRYLSVMLAIIPTTDLIWSKISGLSAVAFVQTLGRNSLPVYVLHLWLVEAVGALALHWAWMGAWQILMAVVSLLILWLFAWTVDMWKRPTLIRPLGSGKLPRLFGQPAAGVAR